MRLVHLLPCVPLLLIACGDNNNNTIPDSGPDIDGPQAPDAAVDGPVDGDVDAPPDTPPAVDGIADARAAADGAGLDLAIANVTVTFLKPQIGSATNDPAGFTIQAEQTGPALFVAVDPATLTPAPAVGDVVSFTITEMGTVGGQRRALAVADYTQVSTGADVTALIQDVSAVTDLVSAIEDYDSEVVTVTGTLAEDFAFSGSGFLRSELDTAGITGDPNLQLRAPETLVEALDLAQGCTITATGVPMNRFDVQATQTTQAQVGVYSAADFVLSGCPAPIVDSATALSGTSVQVTFSRNVLGTSVLADGSQFTFDNGLTASAAVVSGRTVTLTTNAQTVGTTYTVTVADTVTDLQGTALGATNSATFDAFVTPAVVRINELNANIANGCDLIELRVIAGGSMTGFRITERTGGSGELDFVFPTFNVATNDIIVLHLDSTDTTNCNPGGATQETTSVTEQAAGTFTGNFDTAFDFWSDDNGLTATDNVITLFDATGAITDAVFVANAVNGTAAGGTEAAAAAVGAANQWDPALAEYPDEVFRMNAVQGLATTGTDATGNSIQRIDDTDDNNVGDWTGDGGAAQTWGLLNAGQTAQLTARHAPKRAKAKTKAKAKAPRTARRR